MTEISVLMAVYNEPIDYITESVNSILAQTFFDFEFIIVYDNPENDSLWVELEQLVQKSDKIKLFKNKKNLGLALSLNYAFSRSTGKFIARMDADDISLLNRLEKQREFLLDNPNICLIASNVTYIDFNDKISGHSKTKILSNEQFIRTHFRTNILPHPTWFLRREVFETLNGYRNFPTSQDYDFSLRLITAGYQATILEEELLQYRVHDNSITTGSSYKQFLISKYIKQLCVQRKKNGIDDFSEDTIKIIIDKSKIKSKTFERGKKQLREGMLKKNIFKVIGSAFYSMDNFQLVKEILIGSINKRRR